MPRQIPAQDLERIVAAVAGRSGGATAREIAASLGRDIPLRTHQYRLKYLVDQGRLAKDGEGRWARYRLPTVEGAGALAAGPARVKGVGAVLSLSPASRAIRAYLKRPAAARKPAGYDGAFLSSYRPNESFYLSASERAHLAAIGKPHVGDEPAGTYAKQIFNRLLIELSWNSSRLEGNTYSFLDTRRLIEFGEETAGRNRLEAQMILNHKDAIEFLVGHTNEIGFNRHTILSLHAILANNLLTDQTAAGRLRRIPIGIEKSVFHPLEVPQLISEYFDQLLATVAAIDDPFEQSFFFMAQLPYLQPFDDVNKRVSRLSANIPFIKGNLSPLSFREVPRAAYIDGVLGVYELNKVGLLKELFIWAYERSAAHYVAVRQSLGVPDPFRIKYRDALSSVVAGIVRAGMNRQAASAQITTWAGKNIEAGDHEKFREIAETELLSLHEGNFARHRIRPAEFAAWRDIWMSGRKR